MDETEGFAPHTRVILKSTAKHESYWDISISLTADREHEIPERIRVLNEEMQRLFGEGQ